MIWILAALISPAAGQEGGEPRELTQLRKAWQQERAKVLGVLDGGYLESLEVMRERLAKAGEKEEAAAVEREIREREAAMEAAGSRGAVVKEVAAMALEVKGLGRAKFAASLSGRVWRVDHEGEGLRWYFFHEDGRFARKSRLTDWVWSGLDGKWEVDAQGTVMVRTPGNTVQVFRGADGTTLISLNRAGTLTVRPLVETDLSYPGEGKE
jgi:hypothetical protein